MRSKQRTELAQITGMFQGRPEPTTSGQIISNMMYDDKTKGWTTNFGYEKYFTGQTNMFLQGGVGPFKKNGPVGHHTMVQGSFYCSNKKTSCMKSMVVLNKLNK